MARLFQANLSRSKAASFITEKDILTDGHPVRQVATPTQCFSTS
jgi:hypothetical protein